MRAFWIAIMAVAAFATAAADAKPKAAAAPQAGYKVVTDDVSGESRRYVAVVLPGRVIETELTQIADQVRGKEKLPFERTLVSFYLPGMKIGHGAWATAAYNPNLKLSIIGLRIDEEQSALAEAAADKRNVLGSWLTQSPAAPGRLTIYREQGRVFAEWRLRNGKRVLEEQVESRAQRGRRYDAATGGTEHYIVTWSGDLELRDAETLIATGERLALPTGIDPKTAAKGVVARARPNVPKAAAKDAGAQLSAQLFNF